VDGRNPSRDRNIEREWSYTGNERYQSHGGSSATGQGAALISSIPRQVVVAWSDGPVWMYVVGEPIPFRVPPFTPQDCTI